ncbi:hypothetical protein LHJ74_26830 [Streptomyces sp. N2-109]|uniref:Nitroreductase n=1 Tax=Streptomyces gossypii TaxID=2883101 RepID=A0ABT2K1I0_9ACTN|nr:hypothetical protein [Streptomyces gossypii]MCT2593479.1 hypothetical protein [Streptomyces gossypii]
MTASHEADLVRAALAWARSDETPAASPVVAAAPRPRAPRSVRSAGHACPEYGHGGLALGRILTLSLRARPPGDRLRPAPSAGALSPVTAYLLIGRDGPLPPGGYAYDPRTHRLRAHRPAPTGPPAGVSVVLAVNPRRTAAHYGHRAWPLLLLDVGHAAAALCLAARATGAEGRVCFDADSALLESAVGGGLATGELPLAAVLLTPADAPAPYGQPLSGWAQDPAPPACCPGRGSMTAGSVLCALGRAASAHPGWRQPPWPGAAPAERLLLGRRSAAPPIPGTPPAERLHEVLASASAVGRAVLSWCVAVGGAEPGLLALPPGSPGDGEPSDPGTPSTGLHRLAAGDARPTLAVWAAGQGWLAGSGAVLLGYGCPADAAPRDVRAAHLDAGAAVGTAQVVAAGLGLRSRPVGSWQLADLGAATGGPHGRDWIVHGLALGTRKGEET